MRGGLARSLLFPGYEFQWLSSSFGLRGSADSFDSPWYHGISPSSALSGPLATGDCVDIEPSCSCYRPDVAMRKKQNRRDGFSVTTGRIISCETSQEGVCCPDGLLLPVVSFGSFYIQRVHTHLTFEALFIINVQAILRTENVPVRPEKSEPHTVPSRSCDWALNAGLDVTLSSSGTKWQPNRDSRDRL